MAYTDFPALIRTAAAQALHTLYTLEVDPATLQVTPTSKEHRGDWTLTTFPLLRYKLGAPEAVGQALGQQLVQQLPGTIAGFEVIKGFLNLTVADAAWLQYLSDALREDEKHYRLDTGRGQTVMVEFSSPNTNKPLHLGHLRNIFLGDSLSRILEATGAKVVRACLYNDKGIHICKSMIGWQRAGGRDTPATTGTKGDHLVGDFYVAFEKQYREEMKALVAGGMTEDQARTQAPSFVEAQALYRRWEAGDPEVLALWQEMNGWVYQGFEQTYTSMGVRFDRFYYESQTYLSGRQIVDEGLKKGVFYQKEDGSVWIDLTDQKLDHKLVLRSDGTSVYITQDMGTADIKAADYPLTRSVYVIANEQDYHMQVLAAIMKRLGRPYAEGLFHLSYGMVELPTGRMKTREGTVVDADDMIHELSALAETTTAELGKTEGMAQRELDSLYSSLALGALKYYLLRVDPKKNMIFNPEESIDFKGHTGTFIQYTCARINGVLRRAHTEGAIRFDVMNALAYSRPLPVDRFPQQLNEWEAALLRTLYQYRSVLDEAARNSSPAVIAQYAYDLARTYSRFYTEVPIMKADTEGAVDFRICLCQFTVNTLNHALALLGIHAPERM